MTENKDLAPQATAKKYFVKTYGCQMNVYDSERIGDALEAEGYVATAEMADADLVLLNTCHIREKAAEKVYSDIGRIKKLKQARAELGKSMTIGVTGCVAQAEGAEIIKRAPVVDLVAGPQTYHKLPELVAKAVRGEKAVETEFEIENKFAKMPAATRAQTRSRGVTAFVTVQEGCDKFCTFCVVPYTRGSETSRSVGQIVDEAKRLADAGVREITLLGQNVNAWHGLGPNDREWGLGELLYKLAEIDGIERLRYMTSHPIDMDEGLIAAHGDLDCLMPYLHLPVQAGSDKILKAMNRHHTRDDYLYLMERMREVRPDIAISGDFIVGFPGETEADFEDTLSLIREVKYASAFSFKYSPRPGTPGAGMADQVPNDVAGERLQRLQALLNEQQLTFNKNCLDQEMDVLLEKPGRREGQLIARSPWLQSVIVDQSTGPIGDIVKVRITEAAPNSLVAVKV
ncbi:MAG: tRNA (N6-isopentenyl adenosine(37)-C2)-methylthiotransferase MiaB [Hyphomicrobiales bacterium]|nr:MAG: tRNA (N6-isopentenyl adenosine(37)-C2)-methylthiotransferase MiaB [Hyphomicrobiales bacterium]